MLQIFSGLLTTIDPELKAVLSFIMWKFSVMASDASLSQQMLQIKYKTCRNAGILTSKRKICFGLALIGGTWLSERSLDIKQLLARNGLNSEKLWQVVKFGAILLKFLRLVNFIIFLQDARHKSLLERALGIYSVFSKKQSPRVNYFEYMNRDILRNGLAEFLFCVLPMINIPRLRNALLRLMWKKPDAMQDGNAVLRYRNCGICDELPTNVHQTPCGHVFCYMCIKANCMVDPSFLCPVCGELVCDNVEPVSV
ncbi:peroxisome biogenesis factor 2-like isoform X3 [Dendronephthya gigantea]|uniref:peroxisome biogenesis factor 2-like isoform X3 n=1 Tax=Dendronephthya gigantea TaxID=151771 RepID=UPI00106BDE58|nr:peroxisome biogenesis factor 2-like isoform X3 [Dendronephthya gigantea]